MTRLFLMRHPISHLYNGFHPTEFCNNTLAPKMIARVAVSGRGGRRRGGEGERGREIKTSF